MSEKMNELFMMGLGALALTKEKSREIANELAKKGKIASEESSAENLHIVTADDIEG